MSNDTSSREMGFDEFMGHRTGGGSDTKYLGKWKDRNPPHVDTLLHMKAGIAVVWRHGVPRLVPRKDKDTGAEAIHVWGDNAVCMESEETLRRQNLREDDGTRKNPPEVCGVCKTIEHIRKLVREGQLSWVDPVFKFSGTHEDQLVHAGGLYNAFSDRNMGDGEKAELKAAGIKLTEAWKENWVAGAKYIFRVMEYGKPSLGIQVAVETGMLGDRVKKLVRDQIEGNGDEGNPLKHPYVIRWKYDGAAKKIDEKYDVVKMVKLAISDEDRKIITESKVPDIAHLLKRHSAREMMERLKRHALVDLPWDTLFGPAIDLQRGSDETADTEPAPATNGRAPDVGTAPAAAPAEDLVACDGCGEAMRASDPKCKACGHEYDVTPAEPPPPPKPALPKRSSVAKAPGSPVAASSAPVVGKPQAAAQSPVKGQAGASVPGTASSAFAPGHVEDDPNDTSAPF